MSDLICIDKTLNTNNWVMFFLKNRFSEYLLKYNKMFTSWIFGFGRSIFKIPNLKWVGGSIWKVIPNWKKNENCEWPRRWRWGVKCYSWLPYDIHFSCTPPPRDLYYIFVHSSACQYAFNNHLVSDNGFYFTFSAKGLTVLWWHIKSRCFVMTSMDGVKELNVTHGYLKAYTCRKRSLCRVTI